jgi:hypothetical protein
MAGRNARWGGVAINQLLVSYVNSE